MKVLFEDGASGDHNMILTENAGHQDRSHAYQNIRFYGDIMEDGPVGNDHIAVDGNHPSSYVNDTIFLNARPPANAYFTKITAQDGACSDKTITPYLDIPNDGCLRMDIRRFSNFWNFFFKSIDRHEAVSFLFY